MKVGSKTFKGIEYIQVTELPQLQQEKLLHTIDHDLFIKILIDDKIIRNCLQYKDYESWFNNYYTSVKVQKAEQPSLESMSIPVLSDAE